MSCERIPAPTDSINEWASATTESLSSASYRYAEHLYAFGGASARIFCVHQSKFRLSARVAD